MSEHLKREINSERMPGEDAFDAFLRTAPKPRWQAALAKESVLIPFILTQHRTFRLAKIVPLFSAFSQTKVGWEAKRQCDATDWRKLRAWWELLLDVQRHPDDRAAVELSLFYIAQEVTGIRRAINFVQKETGIRRAINFVQKGIDPSHAQRVHEAVKSRIKDLFPVEVKPGTNASALTREKYEQT